MKQLFTLIKKSAATALVALAALCPATMSAQGTVVASNTMSATTADGVSLSNPIFTDGDWTVAANGASAELGTTGADNYGPCLATPVMGDFVAVMVNVEQAGQYVFSFRSKVDSGEFGMYAHLSYGSGSDDWIDATTTWFTPSPLEGDEPGYMNESGIITLEAGRYFFAYRVDRVINSLTLSNLHVADFQLTYMGAPVESYTVNYTVEGNPADVQLFINGEEAQSGAEADAWTMYELIVTPENPADNVSISVNGANVDENVFDDGGYFTYYGYIINSSADIVIRVGLSGIDSTGNDAGVTYDTASAQLTGYCGLTQVYDLSGKLVMSFDLQGTADLGQLAPGVYVVKTAGGTLKIAR